MRVFGLELIKNGTGRHGCSVSATTPRIRWMIRVTYLNLIGLLCFSDFGNGGGTLFPPALRIRPEQRVTQSIRGRKIIHLVPPTVSLPSHAPRLSLLSHESVPHLLAPVPTIAFPPNSAPRINEGLVREGKEGTEGGR